MDQKKLSQLDPKLKAIYERVMGTSATASSRSSPPVQPVQDVPRQNVSQPFVPQPQPLPPQPIQAQPIPQTQTKIKKKTKILPILIILGVIMFFAVYTLVWIKVFNFKLPFLSF